MNRFSQLTYQQRYTIEVMLKQKYRKKDIAKAIGKDYSVLYRELQRNSRPRGSYDANYAQMLADERKKEGHVKKRFTDRMQRLIKNKLTGEQWSPEQIKGWCDDEAIEMVSHERIYQFIWADKTNGGILYKHLRTAQKKYKKRYGSNDRRGVIPNKVSIEQRPDIVDKKERIGDFEIDLIIGKNHKGSFLTIVDRKTGFVIIENVGTKKADVVAKATVNALAPFKEFTHTITNDNGKEFALHEKVAKKLQAGVFFAHPYASWERGLNEYTNKLIRQYFPKNIKLTNIKQQDILLVMNKFNNRPRKKLKFKIPRKIFYQYIYQKHCI